jgi:FecR protein
MPKTKTYRGWLVGVLLAGVLLMLHSPATLFAQDQGPDQSVQDQPGPQDQDTQDPPSRVARMNYTQGSVSFQPGGEGDWVTAVPNRPLTTGDNLWADQGSRAEMHIGSTAIRLSAETSVTYLELDDRTTQLRLSAGTIVVRVRHLDDGDVFEVDTPSLAFNLQHTGEYRIDVDSTGDMTNVSVFSGRGEVTGGGYSYTVVAGQSARFSGTDQLNYDIAQLPAADDFDNWAFERDHREDGAESANYVSAEMTGYEDLDDYGHWQYVGGYGTVWVPAGVAVDWAPYRNGHWAYIDPWGWTWVEDEPWGFAPFHYGRWAYAGNRWFWVPGPVAVRPVYAPALVAFVGGVGISVGGGPGVGWFPLAPGEVYVPYYRGSRDYVERVNVTNTVVNVTRVTTIYNQRNVTNITYVNQRVNNGVTLVSRDTFVNARPVARNLGRVDARQLAEAPIQRSVQVQPVRTSVLGSGAPARFRPPQAIVSRQVVATQRPAPPRQPFDQRQAAMNIRTERPSEQPRPLGNQSNDRPVARPQAPVSQPQAASPSQMPRPEARPQQPMVAPRVAQGSVNQGDNNRVSQGWSHPQAKPAPPVQERNPAQARDDENKFRNWQQQRPQAAPAPKPQAQHQAPREPDKHQKN